MIGIIMFLVFLGIALSYFLSNRSKMYGPADRLGSREIVSWKVPLVSGTILFIGLVVSALQPFALERVDAGHVGIKVKLTGDSRGVAKYEYRTGWVLVNDWTERLFEFPTYQQTIEYPEQTIITKGGFSATIHPKFNYSMNPGNIGDMFQNLRLGVKEIEQGWLQTAIVGAVNDVANLWTVDDIFNHRAQFESDIIKETNKRVSKWFNVSQLRTNIIPPKALTDAINAKTNAIQQAQAADAQRAVAEAKGRQMVAEAQADSASRVIRAAGEAEEMKRKQLNLTPEYIEYIKWLNASSDIPRVPTVISGSGGSLLYNLK